MGTLRSRGMTDFLEQITSPPREPEKPTLREPNEHDKLVEIARNFLAGKSPIVISEIPKIGEEPDVVGFDAVLGGGILGKEKQEGVVLLECKASRADFLSDKKKWFRHFPEKGMGEYRYFFTRVGLLDPGELPAGWGLIETTGVRARIIVASRYWEKRAVGDETYILKHVIRRIGVDRDQGLSIRLYDSPVKRKNKAAAIIR